MNNAHLVDNSIDNICVSFKEQNLKFTSNNALNWVKQVSEANKADELYMLQQTSGSTGDFKLAMTTHHHVTYAANLARTFCICAEDEPPQKLLMVAG